MLTFLIWFPSAPIISGDLSSINYHFKLAIACRFHKRMNEIEKFQLVVVDEFKKYDWEIRSCYHKFIHDKEQTFAWIMALDAVFLLDCLQFYVRHGDETSHADVKLLARILDSTGNSAANNPIFRDLMMLENQLPLFLLKKAFGVAVGF